MCVKARGEKKCAWHQKLLYVVTDYCNGKHLTQPPDLNSPKKKKKTELKGKWVIFKSLKTEPQRAAEPRGAKRHQRPAAKRAFQVTFSFLCLLGLHDSQHEVVKSSPDCQPHSSQLHANVITEISNIRFQLPCRTSARRGKGLICAFNSFNHPCKCVWSCTGKKKEERDWQSREHL